MGEVTMDLPTCPRCQKTLDTHVNVDDPEDPVAPQPGDYVFCLYCQSKLIFTKDMRLVLDYSERN